MEITPLMIYIIEKLDVIRGILIMMFTCSGFLAMLFIITKPKNIKINNSMVDNILSPSVMLILLIISGLILLIAPSKEVALKMIMADALNHGYTVEQMQEYLTHLESLNKK